MRHRIPLLLILTGVGVAASIYACVKSSDQAVIPQHENSLTESVSISINDEMVPMGGRFSHLVRTLISGSRVSSVSNSLVNSPDLIIVDGEKFCWEKNSLCPYRNHQYRVSDPTCRLGLYYAAYYYLINSNSQKSNNSSEKLAVQLENCISTIINAENDLPAK